MYDRAVMVAQWYDLQLETRETRASSSHVTTRTIPPLPDANLRYQVASSGQRMQLPSFVRAVLIELSW